MLESLKLHNFTVFKDASFQFGKHLNVFIGENATGKTHLMKLAYSVLAVRWEGEQKVHATKLKSVVETRLHDKLLGVFRSESIASLIRREKTENSWSGVHLALTEPAEAIRLTLTLGGPQALILGDDPHDAPTTKGLAPPIFLPSRELLSIYPGFASLYSTTHLEFEETWRDTCLFLGAPLRKGAPSKLVKALEGIIGGKVELERERFYLVTDEGRFEIHMVAEGLRKLAMVAQLRANHSLRKGGTLFWDEPEATLNPRIVKQVAKTIIGICKLGVQTFVATHSLFLMRELEMLLKAETDALDTRVFGLTRSSDGVQVAQGAGFDDIGEIAALEEELKQSDRYLEAQYAGD